MSLLEVNKITPQSGTTLTLGDTGDTINFGSGVLPNFENLTVTGDLTVDTNSLKVDSTNNYVGIGTSSPSRPLTVVGTGTISGGVVVIDDAGAIGLEIQSNDPTLLFYEDDTTDQNYQIRLQSGSLTFQTQVDARNSATERMRINSAGNVGIGTSTINDRFVVQSSSANEGISIRGAGFDALKIGMVDPGTSNDGVIGMTINNNLRFITNNTERMRIDNNGNVGIGKIPDASFGSYDALEIGNAGFLTGIASSNENIFVGSNAYLNGSGSWTYMTTNEASYYRQGDGRHSWHYAPSGTADTAITFSEAMRIDSSGNVGIGTTTTSSAKLNIQPNSAYLRIKEGRVDATNNIRLEAGGTVNTYLEYRGYLGHIWDVDTTEAMRIDNSGNVLVGKTSTDQTVAGTTLFANGKLAPTVNSDTVIYANRETNNGDIIELRKDGTTIGSIGVIGDDIPYFGTTDGSQCGINLDGDNQRINPANGSGSAIDNQIDLGASPQRFKNLYLGGSVYLGGTGSANALDDYEEGTYTPTLTGSTTGSINANIGKYTKVGNLVHVNIGFYNPGVNTNSGQWQISLPFTVANPSVTGGFTMVEAGTVLELRGVAASGDYLIFSATGNNSYGIIREIYNSATTEATILDTSVPTNLLMNIDFTYFTA